MERNLEWWNDSEYIFKAHLDSTITKSGKGQKLFFSITKKFKGEIGDTVAFYSPGFGTSCTWDLEKKVGKEFIIYGYLDEEGKLSSHFCKGSQEIHTQDYIDSLYSDTAAIVNFFHKFESQRMQFLLDVVDYKNGLVKTFYSNGQITAKGNFENYNPIGYWKYYSFEGKITSEGRYKDYEKTGVWIENEYKTESTINDAGGYTFELIFQGFKKGKYSKGEKVGVWESYDQNGVLIKQE